MTPFKFNAKQVVLFRVVFSDLFPVDYTEKCRDIVGSAVLVVEVVGVFPDIEAEDRLAVAGASDFTHEWVVLVGC